MGLWIPTGIAHSTSPPFFRRRCYMARISRQCRSGFTALTGERVWVRNCDGEKMGVAAWRLREIAHWVDCAPVQDRHEVKVWTGRPPSHSDIRDDLACRDGLPHGHDRPMQVVEVTVERREIEAVRDDHDDRGVAVCEVRATDGHHLAG